MGPYMRRVWGSYFSKFDLARSVFKSWVALLDNLGEETTLP